MALSLPIPCEYACAARPAAAAHIQSLYWLISSRSYNAFHDNRKPVKNQNMTGNTGVQGAGVQGVRTLATLRSLPVRSFDDTGVECYEPVGLNRGGV